MTPVVPASTRPTPSAAHAHRAVPSRAATWSSPTLPIVVSVGAFLAIVAPRMVLGLCGGDAGELQTAVATLGIAHPPGYATYVLIGWLLTRVPFVEPAVTLTIINAVCGAVAVALLTWLAVRGGGGMIAVTLAIVWLITRRVVLDSMVMPEVYAPSLLLLLVTILCLWRSAANRQWRPLVWAALSYGLLVANRPSAIVLAPGLLLMLILTPAWSSLRPSVARRLGALALAAILPSLATVGYVLLRDRPDVPYNYMAVEADDPWTFEPGWYESASRWDRLYWLLSATQYHRSVAPSVADAVGQLRSLGDQLGRPYWTTLVGGLTLASVGLLAVFRRSGRAGVIVATLLAGNLLFYVLYRQAGLPAMLLPLLAAFAGLMAIGITTVCAGLRIGLAGEVATVCVFAGLAWWHADADFLPPRAEDGTARYLASLDLGTLPEQAQLLVDVEGPSHTLAYQLAVRENRRDVRIRVVPASAWAAKVNAHPDRPWIYTLKAPPPERFELAPVGGLWAVVQQPSDDAPALRRPCGVPELER